MPPNTPQWFAPDVFSYAPANASAPTGLPPAPANASTSTPLSRAPAKASTSTPLPASTLTFLSAEEILAALICLADKAESRAVVAMLNPPPGSRPEQTFADLRLDIAGALTETLDEIAPGLGMRLMRSLYPEVDFDAQDLELPAEPPLLFDKVAS